jgi:hypothetical protein
MSEPTGAEATRNHEHFVWFDHETTAKLCDQLDLAAPCRLEIHKVEGKYWIHVIPDDASRAPALARFEPLNKSHSCPPDCP